MNSTDDHKFLTSTEAARILRCSDDSIRNWCNTGFKGIILRSKPSGRRVLILHEWIDEFQAAIEKQKAASKRMAIRIDAPSRKVTAKAKSAAKRHKISRR